MRFAISGKCTSVLRGVFVLLKKMTWDDARGICLADNGEVPMIIVNDDDNEGARCFTPFHEYAHFLRGQTATCLEDQRRAHPRPAE